MRAAMLTIASLALAASASAHPYLPLREGEVVVLDYRFHVATDRKEFALPERRGKMIITTERDEERSGNAWMRFRVSYRDMPDPIPDVTFWRRDDGGAVRAGSMIGDRWRETVELPADVSVGVEWDYDDGERSRRKVTRKLALALGGKTLADCIEVTRTVAKKNLAAAVNLNYYCRDVGEVKSVFEMPSPVGRYVTETSLRTDP
ncbi:MAG: hypothetical protein ACREQJ_15680 [Candidatus Binatia bacterium]